MQKVNLDEKFSLFSDCWATKIVGDFMDKLNNKPIKTLGYSTPNVISDLY